MNVRRYRDGGIVQGIGLERKKRGWTRTPYTTIIQEDFTSCQASGGGDRVRKRAHVPFNLQVLTCLSLIVSSALALSF